MNEILTNMNSRSPRRKFVFFCCVTLLELINKKTFGVNKDSPQGQESKRFSLFYKFKKGKALSGHVISVHQASSEIACTQKCLSNPKCASFNFEIQQSRALSTCELNAVSSTSPNNKLNSRSGFAYYEPLTPRETPKQQTTAFPPTTSKLMMAASTTQDTQEASPTRDQATAPASRVPSTQPTTKAAPVSNCGQEWHTYRSGCLRLFKEHKNRVDANQYCATFITHGKGNGRLISIFSQDENDRIGNLTSSESFSQGEYYIGLNNLQGTGTYKWADGTAAPFTNWNTGHPRGGKAVVMKMNGNSDNGKWETRNHNDALRFICECPEGPCA
ncbi:LOW QUALITY PROTEIN: tetranectin-like [Acropora millepora]|uniref:LOW QUALITY PROTEIN: tetranectin-like n=1 Tax=Acropora millepora TaxID=45264 RepID=UPI001CF41C7B|nr:LOW QUALITY PROTEIN: tetranectin-like [Acropora millepora]